MSHRLPKRALQDSITIRKMQQSMVGGTLRPVFKHVQVAAGIPAFLDPINVGLARMLVGTVAKGSFRLYVNPPGPAETWDIDENDEIVRESDGQVFVVTEVLKYRSQRPGDHHWEATLEERK